MPTADLSGADHVEIKYFVLLLGQRNDVDYINIPSIYTLLFLVAVRYLLSCLSSRRWDEFCSASQRTPIVMAKPWADGPHPLIASPKAKLEVKFPKGCFPQYTILNLTRVNQNQPPRLSRQKWSIPITFSFED